MSDPFDEVQFCPLCSDAMKDCECTNEEWFRYRIAEELTMIRKLLETHIEGIMHED